MHKDPQKKERAAGPGLSWDRVKDKIYPCLAPYGWEILKGQPAIHRDFIDLAVYYYIRIASERTMASIWVTRKIMEGWGISLHTLDTQALQNNKNDSHTITGFEDIFGTVSLPFGPYLMTDWDHPYGAAGLLDKDMIAGFAAERGTDLYILPSSIHEVILLPITDETIEKGLNTMIRDINEGFVRPEERLADHAYHYDRRTGKIRIVEG